MKQTKVVRLSEKSYPEWKTHFPAVPIHFHLYKSSELISFPQKEAKGGMLVCKLTTEAVLLHLEDETRPQPRQTKQKLIVSRVIASHI